MNIRNLKKALDRVSNWTQFCTYFQLQEKSDKHETLQLLLSEPDFKATMTWKRVAWALYNCSEDKAIDDIFDYMKSPTGKSVKYVKHNVMHNIMIHVLYTLEHTLTINNIEKCLKDNVRVSKWKTLREELKIPPPHIAIEECSLLGIKIWILTDEKATWQKFAMALYTSSLDGALKDLKAQNFLSVQGMS